MGQRWRRRGWMCDRRLWGPGLDSWSSFSFSSVISPLFWQHFPRTSGLLGFFLPVSFSSATGLVTPIFFFPLLFLLNLKHSCTKVGQLDFLYLWIDTESCLKSSRRKHEILLVSEGLVKLDPPPFLNLSYRDMTGIELLPKVTLSSCWCTARFYSEKGNQLRE